MSLSRKDLELNNRLRDRAYAEAMELRRAAFANFWRGAFAVLAAAVKGTLDVCRSVGDRAGRHREMHRRRQQAK